MHSDPVAFSPQSHHPLHAPRFAHFEDLPKICAIADLLDTMGGDCCGGESLPAAQHALNDLHLNTLQQNGAAQAAPQHTHDQSAEELKGFIEKRIKLFEQYRAREDAEVSG